MDLILHWLHMPAVWLAAIPVGWFTLLFLTAILEKCPTTPYIPAGPSARGGTVLEYDRKLPDPSQLPGYAAIMAAGAQAAGFEYGGIFASANAPTAKILATIWISPARDLVMLSGAGTVLKMPQHQTWMFTPLKDGHVLMTTDNNDAGDHSGIYRAKRLRDASFDELLAAHRSRMEQFRPQVDVFREADAGAALLALYDRRVKRMIERRVAHFRDAEGIYWSYTAKGGVLICLNFVLQLAQALPQFWRVRQRVGSTALRDNRQLGG